MRSYHLRQEARFAARDKRSKACFLAQCRAFKIWEQTVWLSTIKYWCQAARVPSFVGQHQIIIFNAGLIDRLLALLTTLSQSRKTRAWRCSIAWYQWPTLLNNILTYRILLCLLVWHQLLMVCMLIFDARSESLQQKAMNSVCDHVRTSLVGFFGDSDTLQMLYAFFKVDGDKFLRPSSLAVMSVNCAMALELLTGVLSRAKVVSQSKPQAPHSPLRSPSFFHQISSTTRSTWLHLQESRWQWVSRKWPARFFLWLSVLAAERCFHQSIGAGQKEWRHKFVHG